MTQAPTSPTEFSYDAHARTCRPDDFLGQTKRTVHGQSVGADQIALILAQIKHLLELQSDDCLAEIACGNGYLSKDLFPCIQAYLGTDISDYMISVAQAHFQQWPAYQFKHSTALAHLSEEGEPGRFTKLLCYASAQYFSDEELGELLRLAHDRFPHVSRALFGNCPDRSKAGLFYKDQPLNEAEMDSHKTIIGKWRHPQHFMAIAQAAGWHAEIASMPPQFSAAYYRFDALLTRA
ncbi:MAG: class I SAM-dependent methyltransferase [Curvibacter sp.]|nr:class I SAM-dependent methyltransferase [Curvibacter sp.]